jgi:(1->4)-alpha-D-glucan 1-alpha-D-glucosylmutase
MEEVIRMSMDKPMKGELEVKLTDLIEEVVSARKIPRATYRLQFNRAFTFLDAAELSPYLLDLGISDCYASPILMARPESDHGYDVCDHGRLNPTIGSEEDFELFSTILKASDMGLILDVVPNHMGIGHESNNWWNDVLENGPSSNYSVYFDIDWHPVKPELENKLLLPMLEDQYGRVLENGKLKLAFEDGAFFIYYYSTRLPVAPRSYSIILNSQIDHLSNMLGKENPSLHEYLSIITALSYLPTRTDFLPERLEERAREKEVIKRRISTLYQSNSIVKAAIDRAVETFNGKIGDASSFDQLDLLIGEQAYRPTFWRVAAEQINYRRFFDVNELAAIRVELSQVFHDTHQLIFKMLADGTATGLRVDHPDGLWNPDSYFRQIQETFVINKILPLLSDGNRSRAADAVAEWFSREQQESRAIPDWPLYVVAEKILSENESLPLNWAVYGTSGYDFLNAVNRLFVNPGNQGAFDRIYINFTDNESEFRELVDLGKKAIMLNALTSEIYSLSHKLERLAEKNRRYRDFTLDSLTHAIREIIVSLPIYRTYITGHEKVTGRDRKFIETAVSKAKQRNPRTAEPIFDFIRDTILLENLNDFREEDRAGLIDWVMKLQQVTGPIMAKGVEDTAFYSYNRLVSLNEVGGNPEQFGSTIEEFHRENAERLRNWPHSMLATSTHDTKRSEDVRARINVLSEFPDEWEAALERWQRFNSPKKSMASGTLSPDSNDEYLFYQTILGAWPIEQMRSEVLTSFRRRVVAYMEKATKEAKVHTSWINPNNEYDTAVRNFVTGVLSEVESAEFLDDFLNFQQQIAFFGYFNSLSQLLLKLTSPGMPDIYQGTEIWDLSLVDPDNRRRVDYKRRLILLEDLKERIENSGGVLTGLARHLMNTIDSGQIKFYVTYRTLNLRKSLEDLFSKGEYLPLEATGDRSEHICAFARTFGRESIVIVVPRLLAGLTNRELHPPTGIRTWNETQLLLPDELADTAYQNIFTGERLRVSRDSSDSALPISDILGIFPVALLHAEETKKL